jgi:hypothetical protein
MRRRTEATEIETKFCVEDAARRRNLLGCLGIGPARSGRTEPVHDVYLDTEERALLAAGYGLRLRRHGDGRCEATLTGFSARPTRTGSSNARNAPSRSRPARRTCACSPTARCARRSRSRGRRGAREAARPRDGPARSTSSRRQASASSVRRPGHDRGRHGTQGRREVEVELDREDAGRVQRVGADGRARARGRRRATV